MCLMNINMCLIFLYKYVRAPWALYYIKILVGIIYLYQRIARAWLLVNINMCLICLCKYIRAARAHY